MNVQAPRRFHRRGACFIRNLFHNRYREADLTRTQRHLIIGILIGLYAVLHLLSLARHPFVHSDEAWLASLTRAMVTERSAAATEDVFRLTARYPHALKTLYHLFQAPFISVSWSAVAARLPSLLAGAALLYFAWRIAGAMKLRGFLLWLPVLGLAMDPQFWYLAHLARQEMLLITLFAWSWDLKVRCRPGWLVALPTAAAVFVHPNAFVIAAGIGALFLPGLFRRRRSPATGIPAMLRRSEGWTATLMYIAVLLISAAAAVGLSFLMDPSFPDHYLSFGDTVGTGDSMAVKLLGLPRFIIKMIRRTSGTYHLADVRPFMAAGVLGGISLGTGSLLRVLRHRKQGLSVRHRHNRGIAGNVLAIPAMLLATAIVGKYGPPTIGFFMLPCWLLFASGLSSLETEAGTEAEAEAEAEAGKSDSRRANRSMAFTVAGMLLVILAGGASVADIAASYRTDPYSTYRGFLEQEVGSEGRVLVNLNAAFAFDYDRLVIWRDLASLPGDASLEDFLDDTGVKWVVLPDELELIHASRPVWNGIYGNPRWYPELVTILEERGEETAAAAVPVYAMRIVPYMDREDWSLRVFRIE